MTVQFIALNPQAQARESQVKVLEDLKSQGLCILGCEVTIAEFAQLCDRNIDPQHTGGNASMSAIKQALEEAKNDAIFPTPIPAGEDGRFKVAIATVRTDLDSVGAMAIALLYLQTDSNWINFSLPDAMLDRIEAVHRADCFLNSGKWEPRPLFDGGYEQSDLAAIARAVADFNVPLIERVRWMQNWLEHGVEPEGYRQAYEKEREQIRLALESGETIVRVWGKFADGKIQPFSNFDDTPSPIDLGNRHINGIAFVQSTLRAATSIGYAHAPVVVAFNPEMPSPNGAYKKFTICQYASGYVDLNAVKEELAAMEPGWGGSPTIIGSPQGESSKLEAEQVVIEVVKRHMT